MVLSLIIIAVLSIALNIFVIRKNLALSKRVKEWQEKFYELYSHTPKRGANGKFVAKK